jgi:hypothetical protein
VRLRRDPHGDANRGDLMIRILDRVTIFAVAGGTGGVVGAATHDEVLTWCGVALAVCSAILSTAIAGYHRIRDARRTEDAADRQAQLDDIRALTRVQIELERRIDSTETRLATVDGQLERVRCRFPQPDGTAKCAGLA